MVNEELTSELNFSKNLPLVSNFDTVIFTVAHTFYKKINFNDWLKGFKGLILDSNNVLNDNEINFIKKMGIRLKVVGRGDL